MVLLVAFAVGPISNFITPNSVYAEGKKSEKKAEHGKESGSKKDGKKKSSKRKAKEKTEAVEEAEEVPTKGSEEAISNESFAREMVDTTYVDAVLLLDASRSMTRTDPLRLRDQGAKLFVRFLGEQDHVGIIKFDTDTKVVLDMQAVNPNDLSAIDTAIDSILIEGGFTDIEAGIESALQLLQQKGRPNAIKTVILLSDGKMDPHPSRGTGEDLVKKLSDADLPQFKRLGIKIYTLSLSDEADKVLLGNIADSTGGLHWFAPDATTVHIKFSDLFLALKQPQMVPLDASGFEIDSGVQEATFYVKHEQGAVQITLRDPRGQEVTSVSLLPGLKWFKSELFDIITIRNPLPGRWGIEGLENPEGFATLLTDLKLQVKWPGDRVTLGDSVLLSARLIDKEEIFVAKGAEDVLFFNYKLVNGTTRDVLATGSLSDKGEKPDQTAADGIYSGEVKVDHAGNNVLLVSVTSPTFTRQQTISFKAAGNALSLELKKDEAQENDPGIFEIKLSEEARKYSKREVKLLAKHVEEDKTFSVPVKESKTAKGTYTAEAKAIPAGKYEVFARLTWTEDKKEQTQLSTTIEFESTSDVETELEEPAEESHLLLYGTFWILSLAWGSVLGFLVISRFKSGKDRVQVIKPFKMPDELQAKLDALRTRASAERREPGDEDLKMREVLIAGYGVTEGAAEATEATDGTIADASAEVAGDEGASVEELATSEEIPAGEIQAAEVPEEKS